MSSYAIQLNNNSGDSLLPVTSSELVQHKYGNTTESVSSYLNTYIGTIANKADKPLIVTLSDLGNDEWSADKTSAQISEALDSGKDVTVITNEGGHLRYLGELGTGSHAYVFTEIIDDTSMTAVIGPDEHVDVDSMSFADINHMHPTSHSNTTKLYVTGVTGIAHQNQTYDDGVYLTTTAGQLNATTFTEDGVLLSDKYASYTHMHKISATNNTKLYVTGVTNTSYQDQQADPSVYITTTPGELYAAQFNESGVLLSNKYTTYSYVDTNYANKDYVNSYINNYVMKYRNILGGTISNMEPFVVYQVGQQAPSVSWFAINSITISSFASVDGIGNDYSTTMPRATDKIVPVYCVMFSVASGTNPEDFEITMPSDVKWAYDQAPLVVPGALYELIIMNNIATINEYNFD